MRSLYAIYFRPQEYLMFFWHKIFHSSVESVLKLLSLILIRKSTNEIKSLDTYFLNFKAKKYEK